MAEFDESLVTSRPVAWNDTDVTVFYDGQYAGCVKKADDGYYFICAVSMERDDQIIQQECDRADSIEQGVKHVGRQWWLQHRLTE